MGVEKRKRKGEKLFNTDLFGLLNGLVFCVFLFGCGALSAPYKLQREDINGNETPEGRHRTKGVVEKKRT